MKARNNAKLLPVDPPRVYATYYHKEELQHFPLKKCHFT